MLGGYSVATLQELRLSHSRAFANKSIWPVSIQSPSSYSYLNDKRMSPTSITGDPERRDGKCWNPGSTEGSFGRLARCADCWGATTRGVTSY